MTISTRYLFNMTQTHLIRSLINRLSRLDAAGGWSDDLNPTQIAALGYLARANRFSRAPSHVADYLGTTRGTMSQTLKSLENKGYVTETRSEIDKRTISFSLTEKGQNITLRPNLIDQAGVAMETSDAVQLEHLLSMALQRALSLNKGRAFGVCRSCRYFSPRVGGGFCKLLSAPLAQGETKEICHEQVPA